MKRYMLFLLVLTLATTGAMAGSITEDKEIKTLEIPSDGRFKAGLLLGYPSGITFGYRFSNWFESNFTAGYNFIDADSAMIRANTLFTLVNIPIGDAGRHAAFPGSSGNLHLRKRFLHRSGSGPEDGIYLRSDTFESIHGNRGSVSVSSTKATGGLLTAELASDTYSESRLQ